MEKKQHEIENSLAYEKAVRDFAKVYPDFVEDEVVNFSRDFDIWNKPEDMLQLMYCALKGSQLPDLIEKAKTEVVLGAKTKKGLPPIGQKTVPPKEFGKETFYNTRKQNAVKNFLKWCREIQSGSGKKFFALSVERSWQGEEQ